MLNREHEYLRNHRIYIKIHFEYLNKVKEIIERIIQASLDFYDRYRYRSERTKPAGRARRVRPGPDGVYRLVYR